jgi:Uma2 family endonuclease
VQPDVFVVRRTGGKRPEYPYHLGGLLLAIEVVSPGSPLVDFHTKRELYLREGVAEYWVVDPAARVVFRWNELGETGQAISQELRWKPDGMTTEFVLNLAAFFDEAFR